MLGPAAVVLGAGGLIPFVALSKPGQRWVPHEVWLGPLRRWVRRPSLNATEVQVTYAVVILSFLGGPHWGFAFAKNGPQRAAQLAWGVTPPLLAWPAASLPAPASLDILTAGLGLSLCVDAAFAVVRLVPRTYLALRTPLTLVAALSLQSHRYD